MVWLSIALGVAYWFLDAALDSFIFNDGSFVKEVLAPDPMCLAMRLINWVIITGFALYAQLMLQKRKQVEDVLKKERDKAQKYLDVAAVMILVVERDQSVSLINRAGCSILCWEEADILGKNWFDLFVPENEQEQQKKNFAASLHDRSKLVEYSESAVVTRHRGERIIAWHNAVLLDKNGKPTALLYSGADVTGLKQAEQERELLIRELQQALKEVKMLGELLPICATCKKIRDDKGYWHQVEVYIGNQTGTKFSHGICPECKQQYYDELAKWTADSADRKTN